jgi:hypothetical protein
VLARCDLNEDQNSEFWRDASRRASKHLQVKWTEFCEAATDLTLYSNCRRRLRRVSFRSEATDGGSIGSISNQQGLLD